MTPEDLPGPIVEVSVPDELHAWHWENAWDWDNDRAVGLTDGEVNLPWSEFESFDKLVEAASERLEELFEVWMKLHCPRVERIRLWFDADSRGRHQPVLIVDGQEVDMENGRFTSPNADVVMPEDVGAPGAEAIKNKVGDFLQEHEFLTRDPVDIVVYSLDIIVAARAMKWLSKEVDDEAPAIRERLVKDLADHLASRLERTPKQHVGRLPYLTPDERNDLTSAMARMRDEGFLDRAALQPHVDAALERALQGEGQFGARFMSVDRWIPVLGDLASVDLWRPAPEQVAALLVHDDGEVRDATLHHVVPHLNNDEALAEPTEPAEEQQSALLRQ